MKGLHPVQTVVWVTCARRCYRSGRVRSSTVDARCSDQVRSLCSLVIDPVGWFWSRCWVVVSRSCYYFCGLFCSRVLSGTTIGLLICVECWTRSYRPIGSRGAEIHHGGGCVSRLVGRYVCTHAVQWCRVPELISFFLESNLNWSAPSETKTGQYQGNFNLPFNNKSNLRGEISYGSCKYLMIVQEVHFTLHCISFVSVWSVGEPSPELVNNWRSALSSVMRFTYSTASYSEVSTAVLLLYDKIIVNPEPPTTRCVEFLNHEKLSCMRNISRQSSMIYLIARFWRQMNFAKTVYVRI
jgi:hypothetical protein